MAEQQDLGAVVMKEQQEPVMAECQELGVVVDQPTGEGDGRVTGVGGGGESTGAGGGSIVQ